MQMDGLFFNCVPFCHLPRYPPVDSRDETTVSMDVPEILKRTFSADALLEEIPSMVGLREAFIRNKEQNIPHTRALSSADLSNLGAARCYAFEDAPTLQLRSRMIADVATKYESQESGEYHAIYRPPPGGLNAISPPGMSTLSQVELRRVREFYKSIETEVITTRGLVNFYEGTSIQRQRLSVVNEPHSQAWRYTHTGVLLCLLDSGFGRRSRQLQIILADPNTAFPLWKDTVSILSLYTPARVLPGHSAPVHNCSSSSISSPFHYLRLSSPGSLAGFCFDFENDASEFLTQVHLCAQYCTQEAETNFEPRKFPVNPIRFFSQLRLKPRRVKKKDISKPVFSTHLTSILISPCWVSRATVLPVVSWNQVYFFNVFKKFFLWIYVI